MGDMDYPFRFDFRDNTKEPSIVFLARDYWRCVAPNFKEFMRLYRPSCQSVARVELWRGISPKDMALITHTEESLAQTVFQWEPRGQISVQACDGLFGVLEEAQIDTIEVIETLNAYLPRLVELGHQDVADAFQNVMKAVVHCEPLGTKPRHTLLHNVEWLSGQALCPPDKRLRADRIEAIWSSLASRMGEQGTLAEAWQDWGPKIGAFFGFSSKGQTMTASTDSTPAPTAADSGLQREASDHVISDAVAEVYRVQMQKHDLIEELSGHVGRLFELGHVDCVNAVGEMTRAIALSNELMEQQRIDKWQQLAAVSRQAVLPPAERTPTHLIEQDWSNLGEGIKGGSPVAKAWQEWGPKIGAFFGF
jgi:hypothetical protein